MKYVIINADDFGYSEGINKGIKEAHQKGVVTSTTVLVDGVASEEARDLADLDMSVGLHFYPNRLNSVEVELKRQIKIFKSIVGRKPDHIDTHKRLPTDVQEIKEVLERYSNQTKTPIRGFRYVKFIDSFFGLNIDGTGELNESNVSSESFIEALKETEEGYNEIMCHVGYSDDYLRKVSSYNDIREKELESLLSEEVSGFISNNEDIKLIDWRAVEIELHL